MNKFFKMNSFFTRIILAVLSFAVIVCIFIPYAQIPAVDSIKDVDLVNNELERKIGKKENTFTIADFTLLPDCPAYRLYKDEALTETVNEAEIPLPEDSNVYYFATYAYGYAKNEDGTKSDEQKANLIKAYKITFTKDVKNNSKVIVNRDIAKATIDVRVPKATSFDLSRIVDKKSASAWLKQDTKMPQQFGDATGRNLTSVTINPGDAKSFFAAITLKSEADPNYLLKGETEEESKVTYLPLDVFTLTVSVDSLKNTLPVVGEVGGGLLSAEKNGKMEFYNKDMFMFIFMIAGAISTLFAFTIPGKFRIIELIIASLMGIALVAIPIIDMGFYSQYDFQIDPGCYVLIALGALIILAAVFDFIRCRAEYRAEMIHIYGEDYFSRERKAALKQELKEKNAIYKEEFKANKATLKAEKKAAKAANKSR